ncbi:Methionine vitamin-b12 [Mycena indigotica]|uniref:Methionine vitamin-b12 n=1 Tax=Mycena indigotica TaxID=2126181 RepID=A0A8H6W8Y6_9AGAR|nr:Methionine vitamin-b12 [Mycena indigotica]KAF7303609.1 Methionine vitamin-b12 [Mycena indigotica]
MAAPANTPPPFRVDHVGSFIRPKALFDQRTLFEQNECTQEDLKPFEDAAIAHVVQVQRELGLATITDGELRRHIFYEGIFNQLGGIKNYWPHIRSFGDMGFEEFPSCFCMDKIERIRPIFTEDFAALKQLVRPEDVNRLKVNFCPPNWFHHFHGPDLTYDKSVYANDIEYFKDVGAAYRAEIKELYELGCRNIQIDEPTFPFFCVDEILDDMRKQGVDGERLMDSYIFAINLCTQDRPKDLNIALHVCRGNFRGVGFAHTSYERIAQKLFQMVDVSTYMILEFDDERSGDFTPLRFIPPNKRVVLGIVTTKSPKLEDPKILKQRVHEASEVLAAGIPPRSKEWALNQILISPQCGFASVWHGNPVTEDDIRAKIRLLHQVADEVWGR